MNDKKTSILAVLDILKENSDANHILSVKEITEILIKKYNCSLDRRTIYSNISMLQEFGYDISTYGENGEGYYLCERELEKSEVILLCNAIHSSIFVPKNNSKELIEKLLATQSKYVRQDFKNTVFVENNNKKENKQFFWNIEIIQDSIKNKRNISFSYTKYNLKKEIVNRRKEPYIVSPYYLVYAMDKTYLICKSINHDNLLHFRVDKMCDIVSSKTKYMKLNKNDDPYEYAKNKLYMYAGEPISVKIRCDNCILDDIVDVFGLGTKITEDDKDYFIAEIKANEESIIFYALQYLKHLEIIEPKTLRNTVKNHLSEGISIYKK